MISEATLFIPNGTEAGKRVQLFKSISAVQLVRKDNGGAKLGSLLQLRRGTLVECCGDGFNDRTIKIRANGEYYFVFLQDIKPPFKN
jgi:hypothetical protein